jgi:hypothetical protein
MIGPTVHGWAQNYSGRVVLKGLPRLESTAVSTTTPPELQDIPSTDPGERDGQL